VVGVHPGIYAGLVEGVQAGQPPQHLPRFILLQADGAAQVRALCRSAGGTRASAALKLRPTKPQHTMAMQVAELHDAWGFACLRMSYTRGIKKSARMS
jgi:hypothetical protein